ALARQQVGEPLADRRIGNAALEGVWRIGEIDRQARDGYAGIHVGACLHAAARRGVDRLYADHMHVVSVAHEPARQTERVVLGAGLIARRKVMNGDDDLHSVAALAAPSSRRYSTNRTSSQACTD